MTLESLDFTLIRDLVDEFPRGSWKQLRCSDLRGNETRVTNTLNWSALADLRENGGNYAFLFPTTLFGEENVISLDGPGRKEIPFRFRARSHRVSESSFVAYVGKTSNLKKRIQWHFSHAETSTAVQVQQGLVNAKVCKDRRDAVDYMIAHATIVYRVLAGDDQAANRDLLEMSLCAKYGVPFNIKSER